MKFDTQWQYFSRQFLKRSKFVVSMALLAAAMLVQPARAVVLEQRWQAGQQLSYDVLLDGTLNVQIPKGAPILLAGEALEIDLNLKSQANVDTLAVDERGTGTIAVRVPQLQVKAATLGQKAELNFQDGRTRVLMNGQPLGRGRDLNLSGLQDPALALRISRRGRLEGVTSIKQTAGQAATAKPQEKDEERNRPARGLPFDIGGFIRHTLLRALPTLWPDQDVNVGDRWSAEVRAPSGSISQTNTAGEPPLGKFDFTLRGEEEINGRKTQRIAVEGVAGLTNAMAATLSNQAGDKLRGQQLTNAEQQIKGDLWFDAAAGQIVRIDLQLKTQAQSKEQSKGQTQGKGSSKKPATGTSTARTPDGEMRFNGRLQMQLRKVSYSSGP